MRSRLDCRVSNEQIFSVSPRAVEKMRNAELSETPKFILVSRSYANDSLLSLYSLVEAKPFLSSLSQRTITLFSVCLSSFVKSFLRNTFHELLAPLAFSEKYKFLCDKTFFVVIVQISPGTPYGVLFYYAEKGNFFIYKYARKGYVFAQKKHCFA